MGPDTKLKERQKAGDLVEASSSSTLSSTWERPHVPSSCFTSGPCASAASAASQSASAVPGKVTGKGGKRAFAVGRRADVASGGQSFDERIKAVRAQIEGM